MIEKRGVIYRYFSLSSLVFFITSVMLVCALTGCSSEEYKLDADEEVYGIIDKKWDPNLGPKSNYKIGDTALSPNDVEIAVSLPEAGRLTLVQAVAIATAQNRDYQTQKESLYLEALDLTLSRYDFARQWFGVFGFSYDKDAFDESVGYEAEVGFDQLLADGAEISASIALDWLLFLTGDPRSSLASILSGRITQPLLRGSGREVVQENLTQAERDTLYELRSFSRFRKTFIVDIVSEYYRVLQSYDAVKNTESNYKSLIVSEKRVKMLAEAGRLPQFEVDQATQNRLRAWDSYVRAQENYKRRLDEFKLTLAIPTDAEFDLDPNELEAIGAAEISAPIYDVNDSIVAALNIRLDLATTRDRVDDAGRKVFVAIDNLGADLDLTASANVKSQEKTKAGRLQFHEGDYSLGLDLDLPFDRKAERNAYRKTLINLMRAERNYQEDIDEVKLDVRQAYRDLAEAAIRYDIQVRSLKLAETRVKSTSLLLQAGRATTRDLLESQDSLLEAQINVTAALVDHTIAKLSFFRDTGILQVRPDGLWHQME